MNLTVPPSTGSPGRRCSGKTRVRRIDELSIFRSTIILGLTAFVATFALCTSRRSPIPSSRNSGAAEDRKRARGCFLATPSEKNAAPRPAPPPTDRVEDRRRRARYRGFIAEKGYSGVIRTMVGSTIKGPCSAFRSYASPKPRLGAGVEAAAQHFLSGRYRQDRRRGGESRRRGSGTVSGLNVGRRLT